jgi:hypothetical protein
VQAREGNVLELRGDEALVLFASARQALRAAVELQQLVATEGLERGIGIGLDTGEAVPVGGGYRGTALNVAARLCEKARAGEVLASETVIHLAARMDGIRYSEPRTLRLKGIESPVRVVEIVAESGSGPLPRPVGSAARSRAIRRSKRILAVIAAVVLLVGGVAGIWGLGGIAPMSSPTGALTPTVTSRAQNSPSADAYSKISGTYFVTLDPSDPVVQQFGLAGAWAMRVQPDGTILLTPPSTFQPGVSRLSGITFAVAGDRLRTNLFYNDYCSSIGTYVWVLANDRLTLTPADDDCAIRRTLLATTPWVAAP